MSNILLSILFTSWLLISFKFFAIYNVNILQAIILNYIACIVTGLFFYDNYNQLLQIQRFEPWMLMAIITGSCFLPTFYLMSLTVKKISVTVSTVASKLSLIIPVFVSLFFLNASNDFTLYQYIGLGLGLIAILLSSLQKKKSTIELALPDNKLILFLPLFVFLGGGLVDVLINISNQLYLPADKSGLFPLFAFFTAASLGTVILLFNITVKREPLQIKALIGGIALGVPNYFSIYFLLKALQDFGNNGALLFPLLNIGVIIVNAIVAILFFKEKLSLYNYIGLSLALLSLVLLISY